MVLWFVQGVVPAPEVFVQGSYRKECPPGQYMPGFYMQYTSCAFCPTGRWQSSTGGSSCKECQPGTTTAKPGASRASSCDVTHCRAGRYIGPGRLRAEKASGLCRACPKGQWSNASNSKACFSCPAGETTAISAATGPTACHATQPRVVVKHVASLLAITDYPTPVPPTPPPTPFMAAEAKGVLAKLRSGWRECWLNGKLELCHKELIHETDGELNERMRHYLPTFSPPASVLPKDLTARSWDGQFLDFYCPGNQPPSQNYPPSLK